MRFKKKNDFEKFIEQFEEDNNLHSVNPQALRQSLGFPPSTSVSPTTTNKPLIPYPKMWPDLLTEHDAIDPHYFNQLTSTVLTMRDEINGLKDREQALLERIEMLEDEIAS